MVVVMVALPSVLVILQPPVAPACEHLRTAVPPIDMHQLVQSGGSEGAPLHMRSPQMCWPLVIWSQENVPLLVPPPPTRSGSPVEPPSAGRASARWLSPAPSLVSPPPSSRPPPCGP